MRTFAFVAMLGMLTFGLVACSCSSVAEDETAEAVPLVAGGVEEAPPSVTPAGWESPFAKGPGTAAASAPAPVGSVNSDWSDYRTANERLRQQVDGLSREVDNLMAERSAAAAPVAVRAPAANVGMAATPEAPAARPTGMTVEGVRAVLARAGASEIKVARNAQNEVFLTIPGSTFPSGKATLRPEACGLLQRAVSALHSEYPGMRLRVEGHTDSQPIRRSKWGTNQKLSEARAASVKDHIVSSAGMAPGDVVSVGYGSSRPVAPNKTAGDMALNRRCELVLGR